MLGWMNQKQESRFADDTTLMAESEEESKSLSMNVKEESAKAGLKLNIQKRTIMASSSIIPWLIDGEKMGAVAYFIFLDLKITADSDCSHWLQLKYAGSLEEKLWQT